MSMSMHVVGYKPVDEKWREMKAVWDSCKEAGVAIPCAVDEFFGDRGPDNAGQEVEIEDGWGRDPIERGIVSEWSDDCRSGLQVDLTKLPKDVTVVRFYCAW